MKRIRTFDKGQIVLYNGTRHVVRHVNGDGTYFLETPSYILKRGQYTAKGCDLSLAPHTKEWFDDCFTNPVTEESYNVPADIREASEAICQSYGIAGICDPMYIANTIAKRTKRGDGKGRFFENDEPV
jgi:hypothetical protein